MGCGVNMKGKRLKDVLDNEADLGRFKGDTFWGKVNMKLKKLGTAIEMKLGPEMNIDDLDYRWVNDRIEYYEAEERLLTREEMTKANDMWNKFGR